MSNPRRSLDDALRGVETALDDHLDRLRGEIPEDGEPHDLELLRSVRLAIKLVGTLRRMSARSSIRDIHHAFGAPGDFGYDTPIGDALFTLYRSPDREDIS